jgi:hypothetical protein
VKTAATLLARLAVERGGLVLGALALVSALAVVGYARLRFAQSPEVIALEDSDELAYYREFLGRWGSDELIALAYAVPDAFAPRELERLRGLTEALGDVPQVRRVWSLDTAFEVDTGPLGPYARPLVPDDLSQVGPELREAARSSPFVRDTFVSADGRTLALSLQLEGRELDNAEIEREALAGVESVLAQPAYADLEIHRAGSPVFNRELTRLNQRDNATFTPIAIALVGLGAALLFRSVLAALAVLAVVGTTVIWTLGAMGGLGVPLSITTSLLPPLLLVIGIAEAIHVLSSYLDRLGAGAPRATAIAGALDEVVAPCFWTSLTTACGFAGLLGVEIAGVRTFAGFAVLGITFAFALTLSLLPALLVRLPLERSARRRAGSGRGAAGRLATPRPRLAAALVAGALALGAFAFPRVEVATHDGEFFAPDHPLNRAYRFIESRLAGVTPFEIEVRAAAPGGARSPRALVGMAELQSRLARLPELSPGISLVQLLESTSPGTDLHDPEAVQRALFLLETLAPEDVAAWIDRDHQRARISARARAMTSARSREVAQAVERDALQLFGPGFSVRATGLVPVFSEMEQYLIEGQVRSYGLALLALGIAFALAFRSTRIALVALVPNLIPVFVTAGAMVALGWRLDVATVMVASVALGIIDDDTIHLTHAYLRGLEAHGDPQRALEHAMHAAGRPTLLTSAILAGGFAALAFSDFQPTAHFGALVALTVVSAVFADLIVLPAALVRFGAVHPAIHARPKEVTS